MPELLVQNIESFHDNTKVLDGISLTLDKGEIGCLLGPSGCGKTTLLRVIAGLQPIAEGKVFLKETLLSSKKDQLATEQRNIGMVFQDFALFPHLNVYQNIVFGLSKLTKLQQKERATELLSLVNLSGAEKKYPHQLSGGQQQRIALARALAPKPDMLLMDEPFSSLDNELRISLAKEVRKILKSENITALLVTHNQDEAFSIADTVGVMQDGKLLQWDSATNLYHNPAYFSVAKFIGQSVFIKGKVTDNKKVKTELGEFSLRIDAKTEADVMMLVRPENLVYDPSSSSHFELVEQEFTGSDNLLTLKLDSNELVMCKVASYYHYPLGSKIGVRTEIKQAIVFERLAD